MLHHLGRNAAALVRHGQCHEITGAQLAVRQDARFAHVQPVDAHAQHAFALHRIQGVLAKVEHGFKGLRRIASKARAGRFECALEHHSRAQGGRQQREHFVDHRFKLEHRGKPRATTAE